MKNSNKILSAFILVFLFLLAGKLNSNAQATLVSPNGSGGVTSFTVTSDVPVFIRTVNGHLENDMTAFQAAKAAWLASNQLDESAWTPSSFIEIHQADVDAMPIEKKLALMGNGFYHIIP